MKVKMGERVLEMGSNYLTWLRDSNDILDEPVALRDRLKEDGYLLIRGLHDSKAVTHARKELLHRMQQSGLLDPNHPLEDGVIGEQNKGFHFRNAAKEYPLFLELMNSSRTLHFFEKLLGDECITYDTKWNRAIAKDGFSGAHYDIVYMGRGTKNVYTVWTPLMEIPLDMGGLAICLGSQNFEKIKTTYGQSDYEKVTGWFSNDPVEIVDTFGGQWATTHFQEGDILIFGMYMMHASLTNTTNRYRMSADIRYQLKREPYDPRWHGETQVGEVDHYAEQTVNMGTARKQWGV